MGNHANSYLLVADMYGKALPLFPVYDLERARHFAARLSKYHPMAIKDMSTGALLTDYIEAEVLEVA